MGTDHRILNRLSLSGLATTLVGNGIGRFAFVALMPALIQQAWFDRAAAAYLGVATLVGYMVGVLLIGRLSGRLTAPTIMRTALMTCTASYLACAWKEGGFAWFCGWRLLAGAGGAVAMVVGPNLVLRRTPPGGRGLAGGVVFAGVGMGIMASGTVVPLVAGYGVAAAWLVLGGLGLLLTALTWAWWPNPDDRPGRLAGSAYAAGRHPASTRVPIILLLVAYALNAVGYVPHTLFWVDYIARELQRPLSTAGFFWVVFGVAAVAGPFVTGAMADRFGFVRALFAGFLLKAVGAGLPLVDNSWPALFVSSALMGLFTPGIAALVAGYTMEVVGVAHHKRAWGWMTFSFAAAQVTAGGVMVLLLTTRGSYLILFAISAAALAMSCVCVAAAGLHGQARASRAEGGR